MTKSKNEFEVSTLLIKFLGMIDKVSDLLQVFLLQLPSQPPLWWLVQPTALSACHIGDDVPKMPEYYLHDNS